MLPPDTELLRLQDGRQLAYTQHGDLGGLAVLFLHGNPGSRYMRHPDEQVATELGLRIITPDRPGFGLSDFQFNRRLLDYPNDIRQLADALGLDRFGIVGVSAGGPYVLACANQLTNRLAKAVIVSGAAPFDRPGAFQGVNPAYQVVFRMSVQLPYVALRPLVESHVQLALRQPYKLALQRLHLASPADRVILTQLGINDEIDEYYHEAARNGARGIAWESKILGSEWGFNLAAIHTPIDLWYWEEDSIVPPQMGRYLQHHLPNTTAYFLNGGGHYAIFAYWREILQTFLAI